MNLHLQNYRTGDILPAETVNAILAELRRLGNLSGAGGIEVQQMAGGVGIGLRLPDFARIARTGPSGIAARSGTTPGEGEVTLYNLAGGELVEREPSTAYNLAAEAVEPDAFVQVKAIDGVWVVDFEVCPAG